MMLFCSKETRTGSQSPSGARSAAAGWNECDHLRLVVPLAGIEPALLAELDFESSASTNSATGAPLVRE